MYFKTKRSKSERTWIFIIFSWGKYEVTYNKEGECSQSQLALLIEIPSKNDLDLWRKIKVLIAPSGIRDIDYDPTNSIEYHKEIDLEEGCIDCPPLRTNA